MLNRPDRDARRLDEARQLRDDRDAQNPSWVAWKNLWDRLVYGTAINAATWRHENSRPCPSCGTMLSPPWRHPATPSRREQLIAAVAKVGVPEAVRRIESIAQDHEDIWPEFIPWNDDRTKWSAKLEDAWKRNIAPYKWRPPTGKGMDGAGWEKSQ